MSDTATPTLVKVGTIRELANATGQPAVLAEILDHPNRTVNSWIARGYIPGKYYLRHSQILLRHHIEAHPSIWEQQEADSAHGD